MTSTQAYVFPPFRLLLSQRQLLRAETPIKLGSRAFDLLVTLVERRDRIVSKDELLDLVWPQLVVEENNLQVQIVALRKLLGHPAIATIPGRGYRFTLPVLQEGGDLPASMAGAPAPAPARATARGNLSSEAPVLIGRSDDLSRLLELMDAFRLVTISGAAGIGKTRLAQAAAIARAPSAPDGAWWVDLAPLADPSRVPDAVAIVLGLSLAGTTDAESAVIAALHDRVALLVLDNAEHLLEGVSTFVTRLRLGVPGARVLVTSQEPLRIDDERVFRPEPLSLPDGDLPERIHASGAVNLFVARAKAVDRFFELRPDNQTVVAEICRRLDGIPLAIELAAARLPLLGVEGLLDKLDQRLNVLTLGHRASPHRHHTLRAALEWSHHLLSADEQAVLRRLAVFVGGFTLEAAQQVAEDEDGIDRWEVLEHLGALVDKSLVVAEGASIPRYRFLETTRLFALERLIDSGEVSTVRARHRDHFLFVAEACQPGLLNDNLRRDIARLDLERDNILAALAWVPSDADAQVALRLAAATLWYWFLRTMPRRGMEVARAALDHPGAQAPSADRCRVLTMAGWLGGCAGQDREPLECLNEALRLARSLGDERLLCHVLVKFSHVRLERGEHPLALPFATEALAVGRGLGDCVEFSEALMQRSQLHLHAKEYDDTLLVLTEALALRRRIGNTSGAISSCTAIGELALETGQPDKARPYIEAALALMAEVDSQVAGLQCIQMVAQWAATLSEHGTAMLLDAAHEKLSRQAGLTDTFGAYQTERLVRTRNALDPATRARLEAAGSALSFDAALTAARTFMDKGRTPASAAQV